MKLSEASILFEVAADGLDFDSKKRKSDAFFTAIEAPRERANVALNAQLDADPNNSASTYHKVELTADEAVAVALALQLTPVKVQAIISEAVAKARTVQPDIQESSIGPLAYGNSEVIALINTPENVEKLKAKVDHKALKILDQHATSSAKRQLGQDEAQKYRERYWLNYFQQIIISNLLDDGNSIRYSTLLAKLKEDHKSNNPEMDVESYMRQAWGQLLFELTDDSSEKLVDNKGAKIEKRKESPVDRAKVETGRRLAEAEERSVKEAIDELKKDDSRLPAALLKIAQKFGHQEYYGTSTMLMGKETVAEVQKGAEELGKFLPQSLLDLPPDANIIYVTVKPEGTRGFNGAPIKYYSFDTGEKLT